MTDIIPKAVSHLRLKSAFKGFATDIMGCICHSNADPIYIVDDDVERISRFADSEEVIFGGFTAYNPFHIDLYLLAIDHKLIHSIKGGLADCALFSFNYFSFIEFKTNAEGKTPESVIYTYKEAKKQLENTIAMFINRLASVKIDFLKHIEVTANIVVSPKFPRSSAMEQQLMIDFFDKNHIELSFDDFKYF